MLIDYQTNIYIYISVKIILLNSAHPKQSIGTFILLNWQQCR